MAARKNPIERRLDLVHDAWVEFAERADARVLCLVASSDEEAMVAAFVAKESDERAGELPDLFVALKAPFDAVTPYGAALYTEFAELAKAIHDGLESEETPRWVPSALERGESDVGLWVRAVASFAQHYAVPGIVCAFLEPSAVKDDAAFQLWLRQFAAAAPSNVRAAIVDDKAAPALATLAALEPQRVVVTPLDLDMPGARLELSKEAGGLDTPGGQFRHLFVQLSNALGAGKLTEAVSFGDSALLIVVQQQWFALAVPIHFAIGAAFAGAGRTHDANERYLKAELAATEGENAGDPNCTKLRAQARMARGGLLVSARQYPLAAQTFIDTLPVAMAAGDARMVLDCHRLASFSFEQAGHHERAWQSGVDGLTYAKTLDEETRKSSTLAYLGEGMMRLTKRAEFSASGAQIEREMVTLLGRVDWRPAATPPSAHAAGAPAA